MVVAIMGNKDGQTLRYAINEKSDAAIHAWFYVFVNLLRVD